MTSADDEVSRERMALSFGPVAQAYERGRPGYPVEAVRWMLRRAVAAGAVAAGADAGPDGGPRLVADVGAGTGKLTAAIAAAGHTVIAIEPDEGMLATLGRQHPDVETRLGSGERIPLPDASVDAVTYGQAWHWVDPVRASDEAARVLRPGGVLGLIWNIRDEREPWVERLTEIMHGSPAERLIAEEGPRIGSAFGPLEHWTTQWSRELDLDDILAMAASRSYVSTASPQRQEQIRQQIQELIATDPATSGRDRIALPYITHAYLAAAATSAAQ